MIKDVCFNNPGVLVDPVHEGTGEHKTVGAAGRSRSLWFLKSILIR
jgi:hypothetical protein